MSTDRRTLFAGSATIATALALPALAQQAAAPAAPTATNAQAPGFYRFKVGGLTVTTVHDGFARRPVQGFVRNAELSEVQAVLASNFMPADTLTIPFTMTFVTTPAGLVAFDAGNAPPSGTATNGQAAANMRAAGIDPARVVAVIVSHFHGDHISGLGSADGQRLFPNAEIIVPATEWAWWTEEGNVTRSPEGQRGTFANTKNRFAPYQGRIRQIADGAEAVPGIRAVAAYGHTPGHTMYRIADGGEQMMYVADITNRPELMAPRPDWQIVFDFDGDTAAAVRRRVLDQVATDRMRVTGYHFPFPANGYFVKDGNGYRFVPGDWSSAI
ncbi:MBL fold metallo-hydrolase [Roseococcus sp. SYP-B2431]|uniref:MBL fold metallo-hydrolase n=1 Tax=Roseococcus sp. SYP-B2431 TaxID=2496640 RepID=UPI00103918EB|nr:MBL fold metallo-hydrolase [Roseococcus sp. SYP-B2431]TCH97400.1 MBL fold metallo-hydrolase [Roseococcus sp. SYP-B2431]